MLRKSQRSQKNIIKKIQDQYEISSSQDQKIKNQSQSFKSKKVKKDQYKIQKNIKKYQENQETKGQEKQEEQDEKIQVKDQKKQKKQTKMSNFNLEYQQKRTRLRQQAQLNQKKAHQLMQEINNVYQNDVKLFKSNLLAAQKLKWMNSQSIRFKQVKVSQIFMELGGLLLFNKWLLPNEKTKQQTSLTVKIKLLNLLCDLNPSTQIIDDSQALHKILKMYKNSRYQSLKQLSKQILQKWKNIKAIKEMNK